MSEIDFVLIWVDNQDPEWQKSIAQYKNIDSIDHCRFRDWDNLKYWFRSVEKNAPWVRKIHFVTCGHYPKWLNRNHPKLNLVKHSDYMDECYLPTFSSHSIELSLHKINGLSERFVYFNDDTFILNPIEESFYFRNNLPNDCCIFNAHSGDGISHIIMNDLYILNKHFNKKEYIIKNFSKIFSYKYGKDLLRTLCLLPWPKFTGFFDPHLPQAYLKSTLEEVWEVEESILKETSKNKFRNSADVNQYLFRYWQLLSGKFNPISPKSMGTTIHLNNDNIQGAIMSINNKNNKVICINDTASFDNFELVRDRVNAEFEKKFPNSSSYEI